MTDSMVERVARALCKANGKDPDAIVGVRPYWIAYEQVARAAIEAMLPPTGAMLKAGQEDMTGMEICPEDHCTSCQHRVKAGWEAMITAALDTRDDGRVAETAGALAPSVPE
jgi:hypothetical protein